MADVLDLRLQDEPEGGQVLRDLEFMDRFPVFVEGEIRHFLGRGDAVAVRGFDRQPDPFQQGKGRRMAVDRQLGPHQHFGPHAFEQRFPVHVKPRPQAISFRLVLEPGQGAEISLPQHHFLIPWVRGKGDDDRAVGFGRVLPAGEPQGRPGPVTVQFVVDSELVAGRADGLGEKELSLPDHGPGAAAVADELHHVDARPVDLGKFKMPRTRRRGGAS